jgi:hypothetical protein
MLSAVKHLDHPSGDPFPALDGTLPLRNFWRAGEKEREKNINEKTKRNCPAAS